jgi:para-aminobenzoate synthetase component 1
MIVDLLRNDLGKICVPGSVSVRTHRRLECYQNVYHLVSDICGEVNEGISHGEILRAVFPGGSITGCPKIRAMEIIDELEPCVRHIYTGTIGQLGWDGAMNLSVAIRTALYEGGVLHFNAGGGIVYDSDPVEEYKETLQKAQSFLHVLNATGNLSNERK